MQNLFVSVTRASKTTIAQSGLSKTATGGTIWYLHILGMYRPLACRVQVLKAPNGRFWELRRFPDLAEIPYSRVRHGKDSNRITDTHFASELRVTCMIAYRLPARNTS